MRVAFGLALVGTGIVVGVATTLSVLRTVEDSRPPSAASSPEIIPPMAKVPCSAIVSFDNGGKGTPARLLRTPDLPLPFTSAEVLGGLEEAIRRGRDGPEWDVRPDRRGLGKFLNGDDLKQVSAILEDEDLRIQAVLENYVASHPEPGTENLPMTCCDSLRIVIGTSAIGAGVSGLADLPSEVAEAVREGKLSIGEALGLEAPLAMLAESLHRARSETYRKVENKISEKGAARFRKWLPEGIFIGSRCALDLGRAPSPPRR
ncbi:MAG: hypothetical protein AAB074_21845 [Planctomycetota bacterium]